MRDRRHRFGVEAKERWHSLPALNRVPRLATILGPIAACRRGADLLSRARPPGRGPRVTARGPRVARSLCTAADPTTPMQTVRGALLVAVTPPAQSMVAVDVLR